MPTILRIGGFRFFFYSHEPNEPAHIHVDKDSATAKIWLHKLSVASNVGFSPRELRTLVRLVSEHRTLLQEAWDAYFM
ncbi:DUF4160 domain-containing protein [Rouxiella badensis]|uniref:DUF4160 domain-containing protein n=1 Tax=Rouxiella badensis TaxID=1646377 RepID=UPI001D148CC2|nr:DUF4160 domain-containing protein [Rouxiella badensis]MCC3701651.1 DUF4160 domain-containing protein [Rouxiella badensis]